MWPEDSGNFELRNDDVIAGRVETPPLELSFLTLWPIRDSKTVTSGELYGNFTENSVRWRHQSTTNFLMKIRTHNSRVGTARPGHYQVRNLILSTTVTWPQYIEISSKIIRTHTKKNDILYLYHFPPFSHSNFKNNGLRSSTTEWTGD